MIEKIFPRFPQKWRGVATLSSCFLINLSSAIFQLWACINIYGMSYFKLHGNPDIQNSSGVVFVPLYMTSISISGIFSVKLVSKLGINLTVALSGTCLALCSYSASLMTNFYPFMLLFSVLEGMLGGINAMIPLQTAYLFYPKNRGLVAGILQTAFGVGGFIFNFISFGIINPENSKPLEAGAGEGLDEKYFGHEVAERFPTFLRYVAVYQLGLNLIAAFLIFPPPPKNKDTSPESLQKTEVEITEALLNQESTGKEKMQTFQKDSSFVTNQKGCEEEYPYETTLRAALTSKAFLHSFFMVFLSSGASYLITINMKNYGITKIPDDEVITLIASLSSLVNGSTRIVWGILFDKLGFKKFYGFLLIVLIISLALYCPTVNNVILFGLNNIVIMTVLGAHFCIFSPMWSHIFHPKIATTVVAYGFFAYSLAGIYQFLLLNYLGFIMSYEQMVYLQILLCSIGFMLLLNYKKPPNYPH